jgi:hypothetical protein
MSFVTAHRRGGPLRAISVSHLSQNVEDHYVLSALRRIWERRGIRMNVGRDFAVDADLFLLHHDRTKIDATTAPHAHAGARIINGAILDISKRLYSSLSVDRDDAWIGPVIVKTNLNHYGVPEGEAEHRSLLEKLHEQLAKLSWRAARKLPERFYPIVNSIADVPSWVWRNDDLLVEKFLPERTDDGLYCVRGWVFLGDKGYGYRVFATHPLVKTGTMVRHDYLDETPAELIEFRQRMQFDFGKFDYVLHGGKAILLDANKTPTFSGAGESPRLLALAEGIDAFL